MRTCIDVKLNTLLNRNWYRVIMTTLFVRQNYPDWFCYDEAVFVSIRFVFQINFLQKKNYKILFSHSLCVKWLIYMNNIRSLQVFSVQIHTFSWGWQFIPLSYKLLQEVFDPHLHAKQLFSWLDTPWYIHHFAHQIVMCSGS